MLLRDIRSIGPLDSRDEPARLGPNIPDDIASVKRGSVAIIIRYHGAGQELLLIKRASRDTDRWSGHIALPGGRQDPGETDYDTAVRETLEEVGIDLNTTADFVGALDPRFIRISWGRKIAMVLCPFVFVMHDDASLAPLIPQESELAAAFWYPISSLVNPASRSWEVIHVGSRIQLNGICGEFIKLQAGDMLFDAIKVNPSEVEKSPRHMLQPLPWKMWGITLGLMQDVFRLLDPTFSTDNIRLPTFKAWDLRFILWALSSYSVHKKRSALRKISRNDPTNVLLDGHFAYFPYALGIGVGIRLGAVFAAGLYVFKKIYTT